MKHILLIEDEPWLGELYSLLLRQAGYGVKWCRDANQAIDALGQALPDLVVLDIMLPGPNGISLLQELRSYADTLHVPVILCSNMLPKERENFDFATFGVVKTLHKSEITPQDLLKEVRLYA